MGMRLILAALSGALGLALTGCGEATVEATQAIARVGTELLTAEQVHARVPAGLSLVIQPPPLTYIDQWVREQILVAQRKRPCHRKRWHLKTKSKRTAAPCSSTPSKSATSTSAWSMKSVNQRPSIFTNQSRIVFAHGLCHSGFVHQCP